MKLLVCGTRTNNLAIKNLVNIKLNYLFSVYNFEELVSGAANGPDSWAIDYAFSKQVPIKVFRPNWDLYGKGAGFIRNKEMVDYINGNGIVAAFWDGKSNGTEKTISLAQKFQIPVYIYSLQDYHISE